MAKKKSTTGCDGRGSKVVSKNDSASNSATAFQSQIQYLARRFHLTPQRAAVIASHAFGGARQ